MTPGAAARLRSSDAPELSDAEARERESGGKLKADTDRSMDARKLVIADRTESSMEAAGGLAKPEVGGRPFAWPRRRIGALCVREIARACCASSS